jgi:hypothetical protein
MSIEYSDDDLLWPLSFAEMNSGGDVRITVDDISSYMHPPGRRERYTFAGWGKAMDMGIAHVDVRMFGAKGDGEP